MSRRGNSNRSNQNSQGSGFGGGRGGFGGGGFGGGHGGGFGGGGGGGGNELVHQFLILAPHATEAEAASYIEIAGGEVELAAAIFSSASEQTVTISQQKYSGGGSALGNASTGTMQRSETSDGDDGVEYHYEENDEYHYDEDGGEDEDDEDSSQETKQHTIGNTLDAVHNSASGVFGADLPWMSNAPGKRIESLTRDDIQERMYTKVKELANMVCWTPEKTHLLLRHYEWDNDRAQEAYYDDSEKCARLVGVSTDSEDDGSLVFGTQGGDEIECGACWDDVPATEAARLSGCKSPPHWFCLSCWRSGLLFKLDNEGLQGSVGAKCPSGGAAKKGGCLLKCSEKVFRQIFKTDAQDPQLERYLRFQLDQFITSQREVYTFCPSPKGNCEYITSFPQGKLLHREYEKQIAKNFPAKAVWNAATVMCHCGYEFCVLCQRESHLPCTCKELLDWEAKEKDEGESAKWVMANTKNCPKCKKAVEKNGGCNHMTCSMCHLSWCWMCEQPLSNHTSCKPPEVGGKKSMDREQAKSELQRYVFYYDRYRNHDHSSKLDAKVLDHVKRRIVASVTKTQCSLGDVDYLEETAKTLFACRHRLKYSYAYGYLQKPGSSQTAMFEYNQAKLETNTELLSKILEDSSDRFTKLEVVNRTATAKQMLTNFMQFK